MNTFTKILIVAVALINIAVSVLFIQMSNTSAELREAYDQKLDRVTELESLRRGDQAEAERAKAQYAELQSQVASQSAAMGKDLQQAQATIISLNSQIARQRNMLESYNAKLAGLEGSVGEQVRLNTQISEQLNQRIGEVQNLNDELRNETLMRQELGRELESARQNAQVKHQLLMAAEDRIRELEDKVRRGPAMASAQAPAPVPASAINGELTSIIKDLDVATVNVGSASGVQEGMKFIIYRGNTYVGDLTIAEVEPNNSSGTLSSLQVVPQPGDKVTTD